MMMSTLELPDLSFVTEDSPGCEAGQATGGCYNEAVYRWHFKPYTSEEVRECNCFNSLPLNLCLGHHERNMNELSYLYYYFHYGSFPGDPKPCHGMFTLNYVESIRK